tara:strand:+ start:196 stop:459 length:264 start_codon:yes stop_codon:yes gene_type:complete
MRGARPQGFRTKEKKMVAANGQVFNIQCVECGIAYQIIADEDDIVRWQSGDGYIQDILHYLTVGERELLISGTCDTCWKSMFGENDE